MEVGELRFHPRTASEKLIDLTGTMHFKVGSSRKEVRGVRCRVHRCVNAIWKRNANALAGRRKRVSEVRPDEDLHEFFVNNGSFLFLLLSTI